MARSTGQTDGQARRAAGAVRYATRFLKLPLAFPKFIWYKQFTESSVRG
jgi:hypothetical protein